MGYPDIWLNIILGVSVRVFWMRFAFESVSRVKQFAPPSVGGAHLIH